MEGSKDSDGSIIQNTKGYNYINVTCSVVHALPALMFYSKQQRETLPDKPTDFQVRVHVLEARKLVGSNPNPTVKVACGGHIQQTSTQKGTNNPVFDEVSTQKLNFKFCVHPQPRPQAHSQFPLASMLH